jgi:hypothetical protein
MKFRSVLGSSLLMITGVTSAAETVLLGIPESRVNAGPETSGRSLLSEEQQEANSVVIVEDRGRFLWRTREDHPVTRSVSGIFVLYVCPEGCGYIKVNMTDGTYLEHVTLGLTTITYFGNAITDPEELRQIQLN